MQVHIHTHEIKVNSFFKKSQMYYDQAGINSGEEYKIGSIN